MLRNNLVKDVIKIAGVKEQLLSHTTNADNLKKILRTGKIKSLLQTALDDPNLVINAETATNSFVKRPTMTAIEAAEAAVAKKEIDKIFLTKDGYLPQYGDYVISKYAPLPEKKLSLNLIPEEYATKSPIYLNNANIYVPDDELTQWAKEYPKYKFLPKSTHPGRPYSRVDGAAALKDKATELAKNSDLINAMRNAGLFSNEAMMGAGVGATVNYATDDDPDFKSTALMALLGAGAGAGISNLKGLGGYYGNKLPDVDELSNMTPERVQEVFGPGARMAGSKPLSIDIGSSDTDILVPYSTDYLFNRAVKQMETDPRFKPSALNASKIDKKVFSHKQDGRDIDIVLGKGEKALAFRDAFDRAAKNLTDEKRAEIIKNKQLLMDAWILRNLRYKRYKNQVADDLGLRQYYF